jgi:uncharacterized protein (DUF3820 family)
LVALALAGCGDPSGKFVGTYSGQADIPKEFSDMLEQQGMQEGEDGKRASVTLDLKADGTCTMTTDGGGEKRTQEGEWKYEGGRVTLNITSPYLTKEDLDAMRAKGMSDEMIAKSSKNPMTSEQVTDPSTLVFVSVIREITLKMTFTKQA